MPPSSAIVGKRLGEVLLPQQCLIALIINEEGVPRVPTSDTTIRAGDEVVAVTRSESKDALRLVLATPARGT